jgi:DNA-directed RNA polymerase subunit RPC12/RpoP
MLTPLQQYDPQIECPRCRRHTVVRHGESEYVCLNCNFRRDLSTYHWGGNGFWAFGFALLGFLFVWAIGG